MALTKVVVRGVLFNDTIPPLTKPVPVTINVIVGLPAVTVAGERLVMVGARDVMVRVTALETVPDELASVIFADPACAVSVAGTTAVT